MNDVSVRDDIHVTLAFLAVLAERLPYNMRLIVAGMMHQLLAINRILMEEET